MGPVALLDDESRQRFADMVASQIKGEKIDDSVEFRVGKKDGSLMYITLNVAFRRRTLIRARYRTRHYPAQAYGNGC